MKYHSILINFSTFTTIKATFGGYYGLTVEDLCEIEAEKSSCW